MISEMPFPRWPHHRRRDTATQPDLESPIPSLAKDVRKQAADVNAQAKVITAFVDQLTNHVRTEGGQE